METLAKIKREFYENQTLLNQTREKLHLIKDGLLPYYGDMRLTEIVECLEEQERKFSKNIDNIFRYIAGCIDESERVNVDLGSVITSAIKTTAMAKVGDIIYHDGKKLKFTSKDEWNSSLGTPVAVVVIPASHMPDGKCRGMSLCNMSYKTPQTGTLGIGNDNAETNGTNLRWGVYGTDVSSLTNHTTIKAIGETTDYGYFPSDLYKGMTKITIVDGGTYGITTKDSTDDIEAAWWRVIHNGGIGCVEEDHLVISPYASDGSQNHAYLTEGQALADMDGKANTKALVTKSAIKDTYSGGAFENIEVNYPAAFACSQFRTLGTKQGDWYLPAIGELGYLCARVKRINESLAAIGTSAVQFCDLTKDGSSLGHWCRSSSECDKLYAWSIGHYSYVYHSSKDDNYESYRVRAFAAFDF